MGRPGGLLIVEAHGVPPGKALPLLPMLELFRHFLGITEQEPDKAAREKIAGRYVLLDENSGATISVSAQPVRTSHP